MEKASLVSVLNSVLFSKNLFVPPYVKIGKFQDEANLATEPTAFEQPEEEDMSLYTRCWY